MRRFLSTTLFTLVILLAAPAPPASAAQVSVSVSFFHSELEPYGTWVNVPSWGLVWRPDDVGPGWQPYLVGHWVYTDYGWVWVSEDPWDPWPYHYGTWVLNASYGWVWVPGTVWAPAWVTWYVTDRYVGWAPVAPSLSVSLSGVTQARYAVPAEAVVFVPTRTFASGDVRSARVDPERSASLLRAAEPVPSFSVVDGVVRTRGPAPERIERQAGVHVPRADVSAARTRPARLPDTYLKARKAAPVVASRTAREFARAAREPAARSSLKGDDRHRGPTARERREKRPLETFGRRPEPRDRSVQPRNEKAGQKRLEREAPRREKSVREVRGPGPRPAEMRPSGPSRSDTRPPGAQRPAQRGGGREQKKNRPGGGRG